MVIFICKVQKMQIYGDRKQACGCPEQGVGTGSDCNGREASFWNDGNVLKLDGGDD